MKTSLIAQRVWGLLHTLLMGWRSLRKLPWQKWSLQNEFHVQTIAAGRLILFLGCCSYWEHWTSAIGLFGSDCKDQAICDIFFFFCLSEVIVDYSILKQCWYKSALCFLGQRVGICQSSSIKLCEIQTTYDNNLFDLLSQLCIRFLMIGCTQLESILSIWITDQIKKETIFERQWLTFHAYEKCIEVKLLVC